VAEIRTVADVRDLADAMLDQVERAVVGKRGALRMVLLGLLADGHVLLDDYPGLAKTLIARSFAQVTRLRFARVQFTPDLMPSDVTGSSIYNQRLADFEFRPGPVFTNLLLGDEINRSPPKTQAALLEAMQERQVTIDGTTHQLERPFLVIATQNPIEYEGTFPLPEAQLDRFTMRLTLGYPDARQEARMLSEHAGGEPLDDERGQALRGRIDSGRQSGRAAAEDNHVKGLAVDVRPQAELIGDPLHRRAPHNAVTADENGAIGGTDAEPGKQRPALIVGLEVMPGERNEVALQ